MQVVKEQDASYPGVGEILPMAAKNHHEICKFDSADDSGYLVLKGKIEALLRGQTGVQGNSVSLTVGFDM
jgi:hypothetical protein